MDGAEKNPGSSQYESGVLAYAYKTAHDLDTDYSIVAFGGLGVVTHHPPFITFVAEEVFRAQSYFRDPTDPYLPTRIPDVVVVNLGTNDGVNDAFREGIASLVKTVRDTYGDDALPIVFLHGMMYGGREAAITAVTESLGGEAAGLYILECERDNAGGNNHPSEYGQRKAAEALTELLLQKGLVK